MGRNTLKDLLKLVGMLLLIAFVFIYMLASCAADMGFRYMVN